MGEAWYLARSPTSSELLLKSCAFLSTPLYLVASPNTPKRILADDNRLFCILPLLDVFYLTSIAV
jgi:hypothetical protein